jgi:hypothetical protein
MSTAFCERFAVYLSFGFYLRDRLPASIWTRFSKTIPKVTTIFVFRDFLSVLGWFDVFWHMESPCLRGVLA